MQSKENLADNVRALRKEFNWSQDDLANECDPPVSRTRIAEVENASGNPTIDTVDKLAAALGTTSSKLLLPLKKIHKMTA